jgi:hypothetical protein
LTVAEYAGFHGATTLYSPLQVARKRKGYDMTMNPYSAAHWSSYSGSLRAVLDEYARAIRDLEAVVRSIPSDRYSAVSAPNDKDYPDIATIMMHVIGAAHVYVDYIDDALSGTSRGRRKRTNYYNSPRIAMATVWEAFGRMVDVLGRVRTYTEDEMSRVKFVTRWNQLYDLEQMLEHAIVHILRHRRQIENRLRET